MKKEQLTNIISRLESGSRPKDEVVLKNGIPSLGGEHLNKEGSFNFTNIKYISNKYFNGLSKGILCSNDILIVKDGATTGKVCFVSEKFPFRKATINEHVFKIEIDGKVAFSKYVYYYLFSERGQSEIMKDFRGATIGGISRNFTDKVQIPLPPLPEQKRIAEILDNADALRQKNKQLLAAYDELSQATFLDMFGDPVMNPKGFEQGVVGNLVSSVNYGTSSKAEEVGQYPYLRMNNITYSGEMDFSDLKYINLSENEKHKYLVKKGDLLFNRTNSKDLVGKTAVYKDSREMAIAGYIIRVRANKNANTEYISGFLNSSYGKKTLKGLCKSIVGMANINAKELQRIKILLPPIELQNQFAQIVENIEAQKTLVKQSLQKSEDLFNGLVQKAFGGEL